MSCVRCGGKNVYLVDVATRPTLKCAKCNNESNFKMVDKPSLNIKDHYVCMSCGAETVFRGPHCRPSCPECNKLMHDLVPQETWKGK